MSDDEFEPVPGLPQKLPQGERLLWQGRPASIPFALTAFRIKAIALYFLSLIALRFVIAAFTGATFASALVPALMLCGLGALALLILAGLAHISARTTVYSITDRRIVMRYGVALPLTLNLPFAVVEAASLHRLGRDIGDLALMLKQGEHLAYFTLWPHARPWRLRRPEPMLRAIPDVDRAASLLSSALAASAGQENAAITAVQDARPAPRPASGGRPAMAS